MIKYNFNLEKLKKFFKLKRKDKNDGFTLVELVAVMAIIAILAAAFIPRFGNYLTEAKKVGILNEAKSIVTAYESIRHKSGFDTDSIGSDFEGDNLPLEAGTLTKLSSATVEQCKLIIDTESNNFTFNDDGTSIIINDDVSNSITLD
ncbi:MULTISPECIES: prepilin-type N-terminal cleavage/methylation domain-containing protein [Clostridium]|uniref:prepilin-type N-terminal cleavage/methylation domain-containing protein n=1 Tax=Clostridium TaxID=1485 RepID=UPI0004AE13CE|nr:prepilin-type N-terminal cleavage/methylation domain-containing protein [Clostridium saudiense]MDU7454419.1 prepilin-type N-terminal cleavage/methylation domain-containing protein [Clostridium saudiense]SCJ76542.1 putative major pilin subunit [uncultured Clostridium sp.]